MKDDVYAPIIEAFELRFIHRRKRNTTLSVNIPSRDAYYAADAKVYLQGQKQVRLTVDVQSVLKAVRQVVERKAD